MVLQFLPDEPLMRILESRHGTDIGHFHFVVPVSSLKFAWGFCSYGSKDRPPFGVSIADRVFVCPGHQSSEYT